MSVAERTRIINDLLGSAHIFHSAVDELMKEHLRSDLGGQLTIPQLKLLKLVASTTIESLSEVAGFSRVTNAAASKAVDRLVRRGLIRRMESSDDRRATRLVLTDEGRAVVYRYEDAQNRALEGLFRQFVPADFAQVARLLDRLSADVVEMERRPQELCFRCGIYFRDECPLRDVTSRTCYYHSHKRKHGGRAGGTGGRSEGEVFDK